MRRNSQWLLVLGATVIGLIAPVARGQLPAPLDPAVYSSPSGYGQFIHGDPAPTPLPPVTPWPQDAAPAYAGQGDVQVPAKFASFPRDFTEELLGEPDNFVLLPEVDQPKKPPGREGFFQKISSVTTYLPRLGDNSVGFLDTELYAVFALPCPTRESPLLITPGTDVWFVDSSPGFDLPSTLYDNYVEFRWLSKITERLGVDLMVTPGWHSDYHNSEAADAYRTQAHAVAAFDWTPTLKIALGVAYLDRDDVGLIPAGGIIWTPNDDTRFELITPRPRIAWRFYCDPCCDRWIYVAGEFGGGQWAIQQAGGVDNVLTARDFRAILGIEQKSKTLNFNGRAELGYVFGRELEFRDGLPSADLPETLMARVGVSY